MTRIERLELAVQHLSERVLGEGVRFEAIAEQEAAEQGVAYTPPAAVPEVDHEAIVEAVLARILPAIAPEAPPPFDPGPLLSEIEALKGRLAGADRRHVEQERVVQTLIQTADNLLSRLFVIEAAMAALADAAEKKLNAA